MTPQAQGHLAMLGFSALVAGSFSLGSIVANDIAPAALNGVRFALAALVVGTIAYATRGVPRASFNAPWRYLLLGGLFGIYFVLMFEGLKTAPPVSAAAVFTLVPALVAVVAWFLLRQVTTRRMALALSIGAAGALWVIFRGDPAALMRFEVGRGEAVYFVGCVAHAVYTPMVRKLNRGESATVFAFGTLAGGTVMIGGYGLPDMLETDWRALPVVVWVTLAYVVLFASAATIILLQFATLRLPSAKVMAYTYLTPTWVILWEVALGNGAPGVIVLGGVGLTTVALLLLLRNDSTV